MSDITPKAQELADEKGVDLSTVEGSGKDGRILVEDVEKVVDAQDEKSEAAEAQAEAKAEADEEALKAEDPAEDAEVVGEVAGDPLVVSQPSPKTSVEAFKAHPHVPVDQQNPTELKDFTPEELETVEGTPEAEAAKAEDAEAEDSEDDSEEAEDGGPGSTDWIRNRGLRERGFYVLPDERNPHAVAAAAEAEAESADEADSEEERPAEQEAQVDTSEDAGGEPTHGESLRQAAPSVGELAGEEAPGASSDDSDSE